MSRYSPKQHVIHKAPKNQAAPADVSTRAVAPSLPPAPDLSPAPPNTSLSQSKRLAAQRAPVPPNQRLEKSSLVRKKAVAIVAMRAQGFTTDEIAHELKIKPASVATYIWKATKNGFLVNRKGESLLSDPKDHVEYELAHKAVRNMNEFLDSADAETRKDFTKEVARGSLFKRFDQPASTNVLPGLQALAIKIEMPTTGTTVVREGSIGGVPAYQSTSEVDGELIDSRQRD